MMRAASLLLAALCVLLAGVTVTAAASHHHRHHQHAAASGVSARSPPQSLSQVHPYARAGDTSDPRLYERPAAEPRPRADALRGSRPNLVFIMADDSGYGDLGANGFGADTPFLDKLAAESLLLTDWHSGSSVCAPSRGNLMTGRLGVRTGVVADVWNWLNIYGLPLNETTLADMLVKANYSTTIVGKWHLGSTDGYHPSYRGFEQCFTLPFCVDGGCLDGPGTCSPFTNICPKDPASTTNMAERLFSPLQQSRRRRAARLQRSRESMPFIREDDELPEYDPNVMASPLMDVPYPNCESNADAENGEQERLPDIEGQPMRFAPTKRAGSGVQEVPPTPQKCNRFIVAQPLNATTLSEQYAAKTDLYVAKFAKAQRAAKQRGTEQKPFFLYVPLSHMHIPLAHTARWTNSSRNPGPYGDTLREMDWQVEQLYLSLQSNGLLNNTLIIYTSDNGPWESECQYGGNPGPFAGAWQRSKEGGGGGATAKFTTWEAGHRMPTFAHWSGVIAPGVSPALASHLDVLPTFMALAGGELPTDRSFDGMDISAVLFDGAQHVREAIWHTERDNGDLSAMRYHQYKAFWKTYASDGCGNDTAPPALLHTTPLIFDVSVDPAESTPLSNPDPQLIATVNQLLKEKMDDVLNTPHQPADYSTGRAWPCCNPNNVACRCTD